MDCPTISIGIIALNERASLPDLLADIARQDYPAERIELVLVDSGSTDGTRELMHRVARKNPYSSVIVADNPGRIQACGWNVFLRRFTGEVAVRVDAHARVAPDFLSAIAAVLAEGEDVVGGPRPAIVPDDAGEWEHVLLKAETSVFGSSPANYRGDTRESKGKPAQREYVNSLFHGAYRREVVEKVGFANEALVRTEDNDFYYRVRHAGYRLRFDPRIRSYQLIRPNLRAMVKQKYGNGYWIGRTLFIQPGCVGKHHLVPLAFVTALGITGARAIVGKPGWFTAVTGSYAAADALMSASAQPGDPKTAVTLAGIFPLLHVAYGAGTLVGIARGSVQYLQRKLRKAKR
ncbi:glycosyltransferase family 2 protein [Gleimia hominis]|uniref:Glycosyltransferase family 2 protein n=1 Tax=Gleimia hominis TaxID=595468 RepID=A0ABU3IA10_9ACTO|nr:glycosyltransferase family 2 protein [Gleimia hominis]MDT3767203.1 glycosyltransferase family 2 protein [Gleimia hominis]